MGKVVFIKENSFKTRKLLEEAGFSVCICAKFKDSIWLEYYPNDDKMYFDIHGTGYTDEVEGMLNLSPIKRIQTWLLWKGWFPDEREFYNTVEEFLEIYRPKKE